MIPGGTGIYAELMRKRMGPTSPQPQGPVMPALPPDPQDYLAQLLAQSQVPVKPPSTLDRIRAGVQVPDTKIVKPKGRIARLALRGLVGGFKASGDQAGGAGGTRGGSSNPLRDAYYAANIQSLMDQRKGAGERADAKLDPELELLRARVGDIEADNKRAEEALGFQREKETFDQWAARMGLSIQQANLALRKKALEERAKSGGLTPAGANAEKWRRLATLMKPWEAQAQEMMSAKPRKGSRVNDKKPDMKATIGDRYAPEVQKWLDDIRRTYAKKLGIDLSLGAPVEAGAPVETGDPFTDWE